MATISNVRAVRFWVSSCHVPRLNLLKGFDWRNSLKPLKWFILIIRPKHWWSLSIQYVCLFNLSALKIHGFIPRSFTQILFDLQHFGRTCRWCCRVVTLQLLKIDVDIHSCGSRLCHCAHIIIVQMSNMSVFSFLGVRWMIAPAVHSFASGLELTLRQKQTTVGYRTQWDINMVKYNYFLIYT